jgi:hypothetical protein
MSHSTTILEQQRARKASRDVTLDFLDDTQFDYEEALIQTGFGKFHFYLLSVCGLIYLNTAIGKLIFIHTCWSIHYNVFSSKFDIN